MSRGALIICYIMLVWFVISFVTNLIGPLMPILAVCRAGGGYNAVCRGDGG